MGAEGGHGVFEMAGCGCRTAYCVQSLSQRNALVLHVKELSEVPSDEVSAEAMPRKVYIKIYTAPAHALARLLLTVTKKSL